MNIYQKPKPELEPVVQNNKTRHWAGVRLAPQQEDDDDDIFSIPKDANRERAVAASEFKQEVVEESIEPIVVQDYQVEVVDEEAALRRRRMIQSRVEQVDAQVQEVKLDAEAAERKRENKKRKKKEKKERREREERAEQGAGETGEPQAAEEEEEPQQGIELFKPVFVSRRERDQLDAKMEEEIRMKEERERNLERKKIENKILILNSIKADANVKVDEDSDGGFEIPNDEDTLDEKEYTLWKIRELRRIKQYNEEKTFFLREKAEIERRRKLTDQQRIEEDLRLGSDKTRNIEKTKYVYMQKYYHKGAFYQDTQDPIFSRDYNLPVGADLQDKSKLPSILQKRRGEYGKRGQSKYTHLTNEDTTDFNPAYQIDQNIRRKFFNKQAGNKSSNDFRQQRK